MKIQKYDEFVNEEISKKGIASTVAAGVLGLAGLGIGGSYLRDKTGQPTEQISSIKKEIPNVFHINEKMLSVGSDFWITNKERENFGVIEQRIFSWGKRFEYTDNTGKLDAVAESKVFSLLSVVEVRESNGALIGKIEQEWLESIGSLLEGTNVYSIYDANGQLVGKSKADIIIKNNIDIYDSEDNLVASFHKPAVSFGDRWKCEIKSNSIDKRLMIFIPVYVSSHSSSSSSSKK